MQIPLPENTYQLYRKKWQATVCGALLGLSIYSGSGQAQQITRSEPLAAKAYYSYIQDFVKEGDFSGTVLIAKGDQIFFQESFGYADLQKKIPNTIHTCFPMLALSQFYTASLAYELEARGALSLEVPISVFSPDIHPFGEKIQLGHLVFHQSGIPDFWFQRGSRNAVSSITTPRDIRRWIQEEDLLFEPGQENEQSHSNYVLLAHILETIGGRPYTSLLKELVFAKHSLKQSGSLLARKRDHQLASGYDPAFNNQKLSFSSYGNHFLMPGTTEFYATAGDLFTWNQTYSASFYEKRIPLEKLGWEPNYRTETLSYTKHSRGPGYSAYMAYYPEDEYTVILLSNVQSDAVKFIGEGLSQMLLGGIGNSPAKRKESHSLANDPHTYTGKYEVMSDYLLMVKRDQDRLYLKDMNGPWMPLEAINEKTFFYRPLYVPIQFIEDSTSRIVGLKWDGQYYCPKLLQ